MKKLVVAVAAVALVTAGAAHAGNWASVKLAGARPAGVDAGKAWTATFSVLQHGLASQPVDGVRPTLTITNAASGQARTFRATPAGKPGVYRARVVFPSEGTWSNAIYDGFTWYGHAQTHELGSLRIDAPAGSGGFPAWELGGALVGGGARRPDGGSQPDATLAEARDPAVNLATSGGRPPRRPPDRKRLRRATLRLR